MDGEFVGNVLGLFVGDEVGNVVGRAVGDVVGDFFTTCHHMFSRWKEN